jgi:sugar/nucleoside kinase (ribokinase family)
MTASPRRGILAGGNFVVDHVKQIDHYPEQDQLTLVRERTLSNGGGPYNLLKDLAAMKVDVPLHAVGLIGDDANGRWIMEDCRRSEIDVRQLHRTAEAETAWTDVMSVVSSGRRTFFHHAGTNAKLDAGHFDFSESTARIFYLGYLTLLQQLDELDEHGKTRAHYVLAQAKTAGLTTVADAVSGNHPRFREIVTAAAPQVDYLLLNELEAGWLVARALDGSLEALEAAARELLGMGVHEAVVIHFERGAVGVWHDGNCYQQGAVLLPKDLIRGTVGAGDAFASGFLYGVHEAKTPQECLYQAIGCAAACLMDPTPSGGLRAADGCLELARHYGCVST